jgi:hypothetical protein
VSLCSTLGKALEHIVRDQLHTFIEAHEGLSSVQHGFIVGKSTISNLLFTENIIADALNNHQALDIVSFDFSRAFDRVPHDLLLQELISRGVCGKALLWLKSFLEGRMQSVRSTVMSTPSPVTSGVIQGSVLGPSLFCIYIDSLLRKLDIPAAAFADDLKIMGNLAQVTSQDVQRNVTLVVQWSQDKGMPLSVAKSLVTHYGANNPRYNYKYVVRSSEVLPESDKFRDLGILRMANGSDHVAMATTKGRRLAGLCSRKFLSRRPDIMLKVYKTYIRPTMLYASQVWFPHWRYEIDDLEGVQRRFTRRVVGLRYKSYGQRLRSLDLLSIESTCMAADLITVYKLLHGMHGITAKEAGLQRSEGITRATGIKLRQQRVSKESLKSLFKFRAPKLWNALPLDILQSVTLSEFKRKLEKWLLTADLAFFD